MFHQATWLIVFLSSSSLSNVFRTGLFLLTSLMLLSHTDSLFTKLVSASLALLALVVLRAEAGRCFLYRALYRLLYKAYTYTLYKYKEYIHSL